MMRSRTAFLRSRLAAGATPRFPMFSKVSLKIALSVSGVATALLFGASLVGMDVPFWIGLLLVAATGLTAYVAGCHWVASRLELARSTLKQIRKHRFENLGAACLPKGDELNALIRQVYRTGLVLEKEINELKRLESYRREFIGDASHELKTPIFAIQGFAETLLDGALEDGRVNRAFVEKILRNTQRLGNLARDLSEISSIETGELKMTMKPFNLARLVREVSESLEPAARERAVTLQYEIAEGFPLVLGDRERVRQVIINLADNAIKYNNPNGYVRVVARRVAGDQAEISVIDDGIGIAPQHISRVTERFFRIDKSRSRGQGGTGLGLAIVKHILNAHESQLQIESWPGHGSTFSFLLPVMPREPVPRTNGVPLAAEG